MLKQNREVCVCKCCLVCVALVCFGTASTVSDLDTWELFCSAGVVCAGVDFAREWVFQYSGGVRNHEKGCRGRRLLSWQSKSDCCFRLVVGVILWESLFCCCRTTTSPSGSFCGLVGLSQLGANVVFSKVVISRKIHIQYHSRQSTSYFADAKGSFVWFVLDSFLSKIVVECP